METSSLLQILETRPSAQRAIMLVSHQEVLKTLTYETVLRISAEIRTFLQKNVNREYPCIGLFMEKNILMPSIIISFQELNIAFTFLTSDNIVTTVNLLDLKWVLSANEFQLSDKSFTLVETLFLSITGDHIYLWLNNNLAIDGQDQSLVSLSTYKDVFCVMQTSGTTGKSKIVKVPFNCIRVNVISLNKHFRIYNEDVVYWGTPLTFDPSLIELLLGLLFGGTLLIVSPGTVLNPFLLYQSLFFIGLATFLQIVPSVFLRWSPVQISQILLSSSLKLLAFGGECFPKELLTYPRNPNLQIYNLYGITELSCWATIANATTLPHNQEVPLGDPLDETFVSVDEDSEISIGSNTRYCLINNAQIHKPYVVKTGDLGQWQDGNLLFLGRKVRSIKRFGHKILLHKLEELIFNEIGLRSRFVYHTSIKKLLAFIIIEEFPPSESVKIRMLDKLRIKILNTLPQHSFPDFLDVVCHLPLTAHGKISDKELVNHYEHFKSRNSSNIETVFIEKLSNYLKTDLKNNLKQLGKHTFRDLGGSSLLTVQFVEAFEAEIQAKAPEQLINLLLNDPIEECINFLRKNIRFKRLLESGEKKSNESEDAKLPKIGDFSFKDYVLWSYDLKGCVDAPPTAFQRLNCTYIACGSFAHRFAILDELGKEHCSFVFPKELAAQPAVSSNGKFVFVGCSNGVLYCVDVDLKKIVWEFKTGQEIKSFPCVCNDAIVFGNYDEQVYCLDIQEGSLLWKTKLQGNIKADPVYDEAQKTIFFGTIKGTCYALNVSNGRTIWNVNLGEPIFGAGCIVQGRPIWATVNGKVYTELPEDASKFIEVGGHIFSSLRRSADGLSFHFGCHDSFLYSVEGDHLELVKTAQLESQISSTPFLVEVSGSTFLISVCNSGLLYAVNVSTKKIVFKTRLPSPSFSSPYVLNMKVYIGCRDDNLYCIDLKKVLINSVT
ncbi:beta-alanine-activating enzyme [Euwallacea similis]|uniref:beta-alanine-activating enzyme n=1 Tax=Euwallacea similis TaxID=1736056 RepID=UPI00344E5CE5